MSKQLMILMLGTSLVACAHNPAKNALPEPARSTAEEHRRAEDAQLTAQLDSKEVQDYVCYICGLPQPERWEKAKALLANNRVLAACAIDEDHPIPQEFMKGEIASVPACPAETDHHSR